MKISRLMVRGYQQFEDLDLDLTNSVTKEPLDRVCFLGPNGTGKSTLLRFITHRLSNTDPLHVGLGGLVLVGQDDCGVLLTGPAHREIALAARNVQEANTLLAGIVGTRPLPTGVQQTTWSTRMHGSRDLVASVSADHATFIKDDPPRSSLHASMTQKMSPRVVRHVGPQFSEDFWEVLTAITVARRDDQFRAFLSKPENRQRTVEDAEREFVVQYPDILPHLASLWDRLLEPAGLEVDLENVVLPKQLVESLSLTLRVRRTKAKISYNALSSGLRSFLFRLGYLKALFFERPTGSSFVLVDEPEASLHPDFLYDIVDVYQSVCVGSQLFFATHSPIVAAQFKPEERVILEFDENRFVKARRGSAPEGDDPNDVLRSDFHVRSVLGKEGVKKWERFLELDQLLRREQDAALREKYRREYMEIGAAYNFEPRTQA